MFSPGAAMPTHGPVMVNFDGCPSGVSDAAESTYGCQHEGMETAMTPAQFRGSSGRPRSVSGFDSHDVPPATDPVDPVFPAAATITASLSTAAYRIAAPSASWSILRSAGRQVTAETLITRAPRSAACTTARASVATSSDALASSGSPPGVRGENFADVALIDSTRAAGATPEKPSSPAGAGWPAMIPATRVPCPSQSVRPSVVSTKSPPGSTLGRRGPGRTPVSMTATSWPSPRENCHASGRFSVAWLGVTTLGSLPGMTPEALHGPRCSIGCPGPGAPLGGGTLGSTVGGLIAAAGQAHITATNVVAAQANPVRGPARIIDSVSR